MIHPRLVHPDLPDDLFTQFSNAGEIAVDCEMMGLNPNRDRLCLVQLYAEGNPSVIVKIDENQTPVNLKTLMENKEILKVFHYAPIDTLFLDVRLGIKVANIFCTKIASKLARTYTERHGLKELVREFTGEVMDKTNQSSDWGQKELSPDQLKYAANDVVYLFQIKRKLEVMIQREGRSELADRIFKFLETRRELDRLGYGDIYEF